MNPKVSNSFFVLNLDHRGSMSAGKSGSTFVRTYFSLIIINKLKFQITKIAFQN